MQRLLRLCALLLSLFSALCAATNMTTKGEVAAELEQAAAQGALTWGSLLSSDFRNP